MMPAVGYTEMKDSGIKGIGEIPAIWKVSRVHNLFFEVSDRYTELKDDQLPLLAVSEYYGVAERAEKIDADTVLVRAETLEGYKKCKKGDIVSNIMLAWKNALGQSPMDGIVSPAYCVYRPREGVNSKYYHYLFRTKRYADIFRVNSTGLIDSRLRLYSPKFFVLQIPVPSYEEQSAIAAYLDTQCARIDEIIAEAKASIEDYKQWKASIICEAVTKGLDPDAEMKDSGIEWIGEIPKEWRVCKTLHALSMPITDGPHTTPELFDDGVPFISAEAVSCGNGYIDFSHKRGFVSEEFYQECCKKYIPQIDDIYMIKSGATTGRVAIVDTGERFTIWSPLAVFRANNKRMLPRYLFYFVQSDAYQKQVAYGWTYGTQQNIGMRTLETLKLCLPPIYVQKYISDFLDRNCTTIDKLVIEKQALIADLESYKKSLIYEVVTGKRRVC